MSESKINPLIPLICCSFEILQSLLLRPTPPNPFPSVILPNIVPLYKGIQNQIHTSNPNQHSITPAVIWFIVIAVNVWWDDISKLYRHVIECRGDGASSYGICVSWLECHLDGVDVWVSCQKSEKSESDPGRGPVRNCFQGDQKRETPYLGKGADI